VTRIEDMCSDNTPTKPPDKTSCLILNVGIGVLAVFCMLVSLAKDSPFWFAHSWHEFSVPIRLFGIGLLLVAIVPPIAFRLGHGLAKALGGLSQRMAGVMLLALMALLLLTLYLLASANHLLGDGYTILSNIATGKIYSPTEPLTYLVNSLLSRPFGQSTEAALIAFRIGAGIAGLAFLFGLYLLIRDKRDGFLLLVAVLGFGSIQFFAGYVENYTYSFVFSFFYLLSAGRDFEKNRVSISSVMCLLCAIAFHVSSCVFVPALFYQFYHKMPSQRERKGIAILAVMIALAGLIYLSLAGLLSQAFVPLVPTKDNPYHLFSAAHLLDLFNLLLRNSPLLLPLLMTRWMRELPQRNFYLVALASALLFTLLVDPKIGAIRDWDLLSISAAPVLALLLSCLSCQLQKNRGIAYSVFVPLLLFGLLHTGSWVHSNSDRDTSYEFVKGVMRQDVHNSPSYYEGYRLLSWSTITGNIYQDFPEAERTLGLFLSKHPRDQHQAYKLALRKMHVGKRIEAAELLKDNWSDLVLDSETLLTVARMFHDAGWNRDEEAVLDAYVRTYGYQELPTFALGAVKRKRGELDSAWILMSMAMTQADSLADWHKLNYALFALELGNRKIGREVLVKLAKNSQWADTTRARLLIEALDRNDTLQVKTLMKAISLTL
jgi:hypothetical protein